MDTIAWMRLAAVVEVSRAVAGTSGRLEKVGHLADLLRRVPPDEVAIVIAFLSGEPRQGRMKIGGAVLSGLRGMPPADAPALELRESTRCSIASRRCRARDRPRPARSCCAS